MLQNILQVVVLLLRAGLAAMLVAAGSAKLADLRSFALTLMGLGLPARWRLLLRGLALLVPLFEMGLGLAIVSGLWPSVTDGVVLVLMVSFSIVVIVALRRKLKVSCRCFGMLSDSQFSSKGLIRSVVLTGVAALVFLSGNALSLPVTASPAMSILLVAGFLLFALAAAQAAQALAVLKEGMPG